MFVNRTSSTSRKIKVHAIDAAQTASSPVTRPIKLTEDTKQALQYFIENAITSAQERQLELGPRLFFQWSIHELQRLIFDDADIAELRKFLATRWEIMAFSCPQLHYYIAPENKVNQACMALAQALEKVTGESRYQLLMPTLKFTTNEITLTDLTENNLELHQFILSDNKDHFIEILPCLDLAVKSGELKHTSLFDGEIKNLSDEEKMLLFNHSPAAHAYWQAICEKIEAEEKSESFGAVLNRLTNQLLEGGVKRGRQKRQITDLAMEEKLHAGEEYNSGVDANVIIALFSEWLMALDAEETERLMQLTAPGLTVSAAGNARPATFFDIWDRLARPAAAEYRAVRFCVELIAGNIESIYEHNKEWLDATFPKNAVNTSTHFMPVIEKKIADKRKALEKTMNDDNFIFYKKIKDNLHNENDNSRFTENLLKIITPNNDLTNTLLLACLEEIKLPQEKDTFISKIENTSILYEKAILLPTFQTLFFENAIGENDLNRIKKLVCDGANINIVLEFLIGRHIDELIDWLTENPACLAEIKLPQEKDTFLSKIENTPILYEKAVLLPDFQTLFLEKAVAENDLNRIKKLVHDCADVNHVFNFLINRHIDQLIDWLTKNPELRGKIYPENLATLDKLLACPVMVCGMPFAQWKPAQEQNNLVLRFFSATISKNDFLQLANNFLQAVVFGDQANAEKLLQKHAHLLKPLLTTKIKVSDYAGRKIYGTALQMAMGAKDVGYHPDEECMVEMLQKYLRKLPNAENIIAAQIVEQFPRGWKEKEEARMQRDEEELHKIIHALAESKCDSFKEEDWDESLQVAFQHFTDYLKPKGIIKTGYHFNEHLLVMHDKLYKKFYLNFGDYSSPKNKVSWCKINGGILRRVSAHMAHIICTGLGNIVERHSCFIRRSFEFCNPLGNAPFFPIDLSARTGLGFDFSISGYSQGVSEKTAIGPYIGDLALLLETILSENNKKLDALIMKALRHSADQAKESVNELLSSYSSLAP